MKFFLIALFLSSTLLADSMIDEATKILSNKRISAYDYKKSIDEKEGVYIFDCSTFISFILKKSSPKALKALHVDEHHTHARAKNFYEFLSPLIEGEIVHGWMGIKQMQNVHVGDIIVWKYDPSLKKHDTGHVVMVYEKPILEEEGLWRVRVMDSTKGKHAQDSRGQNENGLGIGTMWFRVNKEDFPIALHNSDKLKKPVFRDIAMGRVL
ncbi:MAG: hypothetical protein PHN18_05055 [Sulfurospirillaceae bacterium]|jgi:hypothetical protein|nr:hypothetical protein [Sulfurospirillaceae bacterium]MDD2825677.1 hypothetical protein [Sulfurospirillaceae bacterium]